VHASWQQKPSTQFPEAHWLPSVHACPFAARHAPLPLHACVPAHAGVEFTSAAPFATNVEQAPVAQV
jgi:hypothetical protein